MRRRAFRITTCTCEVATVLKAGSDAVIQKAMQQPEWVATGLGDSVLAKDAFGRSLVVEHPDDSENLLVMFQSKTASKRRGGEGGEQRRRRSLTIMSMRTRRSPRISSRCSTPAKQIG